MSGAGPVRILLVEDEPVNRALVRAVLRRSSSERLRDAVLVEAETLAAARAAAAEHRPDVILLDVRLPDGSGLDLARDLARDEAGVRPKVIVMSASVLPTDRAAADGAGGDAFLGKPFLPADLVELLEAYTGE